MFLKMVDVIYYYYYNSKMIFNDKIFYISNSINCSIDISFTTFTIAAVAAAHAQQIPSRLNGLMLTSIEIALF